MTERLVKLNQKLTAELTDRDNERYFDLPHYLAEFDYPVTLELVEGIGHRVYQKESADAIEFLMVMATKMYTWIVRSSDRGNILEEFLYREDKKIRRKTSKLIRSVKKWERKQINDANFAKEIESFCQNTYGVRLPVLSFFLRTLRPERFATLDQRATSALKRLGFKGVKDIPQEKVSIGEYLTEYTGLDYLAYNELLTEIGKHYVIGGPNEETIFMSPSEVDMALYSYDRISGPSLLKPKSKKEELRKLVMESHKGRTEQEACNALLEIIEEIDKGAREVAAEEWAIKGKWSGKIRGSAAKLKRFMKKYAIQGDLEAMFEYYLAAMADRDGIEVGKIVSERGKPSLETEFSRAKAIYESAKNDPR